VYTSKEKKKNEERVTKYTSISGRKVKMRAKENERMNIMSSNRREKKKIAQRKRMCRLSTKKKKAELSPFSFFFIT
jgi:hypothetical protein